ncbi:MAG: M48 family metallopeptidase [Myxococcota bacterium]
MKRFPSGYACMMAVGLMAACSAQQRVDAQVTAAKALVSDEDENRIGEQVHAELEKQGIRYLNNPTVTSYVEQIAKPIIDQARDERPGVHWHVHVVDDPKTVNAFATPGGHLYVMSGLLSQVDTDAELAGVLAHEAGHVVARHTARQLVALYGMQTVAAMALGKDPTLIKQVAAMLATRGVLLAYTRSAEREADEWGARFASAADFDPHGIVKFFEKLKAREGQIPQVLTWLMDHPPTADRIAHVNQFIDENNLGGGKPDSGRLPAVKQAIVSGVPRAAL